MKEILNNIYSILSHLILDNPSNYSIGVEKSLNALGKLIDNFSEADLAEAEKKFLRKKS